MSGNRIQYDVEDELSSLTDVTTNWIIDHADQFDPLEPEPSRAISARRKAFSELGLALMVRSSYASVEPTLHELVTERASDSDYYGLLRRYPRQVIRFANPLLYAADADKLSPEALAALQEAFERECVWNTERPAYERLQLLHQSILAPGVEPRQRPEEVVSRSFIERPPNVVTAEAKAAYQLTHDVFFASNVGRRSEGFRSTSAGERLRSTVVGLLARSMAREQTDLTIELLAAGSIERALPQGVIAAGLDWLQDRTTDGKLPGPDMSDASDTSVSHGDLSVLDPPLRHWAEHYHTNLTAAFLLPVVREYIDEAPHCASIDREQYRDSLCTLGDAVDALSNYELRSGAQSLRSVGTDGPDVFEDVIQECLAYLRMQRQADGSYGHWWDKRVVLRQRTDASVDVQSLTDPIAAECTKTIEALGGENG